MRLPGLLVLVAAARLAAQTVEGSVFDAATGAAVAGVKVELLKQATPFYETTSDGGGRFRFDGVREGDYAIRYQSPDYWLTAGPSDYRVFRVAEGSPVKLEARLMPWSKISGRVVDGRGNGVPKARMELTGSGMTINGRTYLRTSWAGGGGGQLSEAPLGMPLWGNADDQGKFEVQLMPGTYRLAADPPPELKPPEPDEDGRARAWKRIYYPRGAHPEEASNIVVVPGGEVAGVELRLLAVPTRVVRGVVVNPDGAPGGGVKVALGNGFSPVTVESKSDGAFEFPAVAEGEWLFSAERERDGVKLRATQWIEVKGHDLENVKLRLAAPLTVRGSVVVDAPKDAPPLRPGPLIMVLVAGRTHRDSDAGPLAGVVADPDARGNFTVRDAYPGTYFLGRRVQPPPAPYYLDAVRVGDADLLLGDVEITSDATITVVYKADGGSVRGTAEGCAMGGVVLVPREAALRGRGFSRSGPCDASDHYEVRAVRPGEYYAVALAGNGPVVTLDEALLKDAVKVTVRAGEASTADIRTVTRPVY